MSDNKSCTTLTHIVKGIIMKNRMFYIGLGCVLSTLFWTIIAATPPRTRYLVPEHEFLTYSANLKDWDSYKFLSDRRANCAVKHGCEPKSVLHTANAMDNALPTANKGNFGEAIGYSDTRRYHQTMVDLNPTHRRWNTQPLKRSIPHFYSKLNKKQC